jgi:CMP-N,N'-diacetyllegionaminic acid synthase
MIAGRRVLAVVPARGGSKGIKLKNLRKIRGRPLVAMAGDVLRDVPEVDRRVVSTDHAEIAKVSCDAGLDAPFLRPEEISGDRIGDWDVLAHALGACEALDGLTYDVIVMVQPTSPLRKAAHVSAAIRMLVDGDWDAVWTVSATDSKGHPFKQLVIDGESLRLWDERGASIIARQQLTPVYHRNGIAYAVTRECLLEQKTLMGRRWGALRIEGEHISIDTEWDIALVELLLSSNERLAGR